MYYKHFHFIFITWLFLFGMFAGNCMFLPVPTRSLPLCNFSSYMCMFVLLGFISFLLTLCMDAEKFSYSFNLSHSLHLDIVRWCAICSVRHRICLSWLTLLLLHLYTEDDWLTKYTLHVKYFLVVVVSTLEIFLHFTLQTCICVWVCLYFFGVTCVWWWFFLHLLVKLLNTLMKLVSLCMCKCKCKCMRVCKSMYVCFQRFQFYILQFQSWMLYQAE